MKHSKSFRRLQRRTAALGLAAIQHRQWPRVLAFATIVALSIFAKNVIDLVPTYSPNDPMTRARPFVVTLGYALFEYGLLAARLLGSRHCSVGILCRWVSAAKIRSIAVGAGAFATLAPAIVSTPIILYAALRSTYPNVADRVGGFLGRFFAALGLVFLGGFPIYYHLAYPFDYPVLAYILSWGTLAYLASKRVKSWVAGPPIPAIDSVAAAGNDASLQTRAERSDLQQRLREGRDKRISIVLQTFGGIVVLVTAITALGQWRSSENKALSDDYATSIANLTGDLQEAQVGAVRSLERIARSSGGHDRAVVDVLALHVETHAPWPPDDVAAPTQLSNRNTLPPLDDRSPSVAAAFGSLYRLADNHLSGPVVLESVDLRGVDLYSQMLPRQSFLWFLVRDYQYSPLILERSELSSADLRTATMRSASVEDTNFSSSDMREVDLSDANATDAVFTSVRGDGIDMAGSNLNGANFTDATLTDGYFADAIIVDANFENATLDRAVFSSTNVASGASVGVVFSGVDFSGASFEAADLRSVRFENKTTLDGADFERAILRGADLRGSYLSRLNFESADLGTADLQRTFLAEANLRGADLSDADLSFADLSFADLRGADLRGASLEGANLRGADTRGALLP